MSVSAVSNSDVNLDVKNAIDDRCDSDVFRAAVPFVAEHVTFFVGYTALAVMTAKINLVVLPVFFAYIAFGEASKACATILVGKASNNVAEFNELLKPTLDRVGKAVLSVGLSLILIKIFF